MTEGNGAVQSSDVRSDAAGCVLAGSYAKAADLSQLLRPVTDWVTRHGGTP